MQKLDEREPAPPRGSFTATPALAVQFFLIPLAVVGVVVLVYGGFRMLVTNERTPEEFLSDVRVGGRERRWPAAYELSRMLDSPEVEARHPGLGPAIVQAFADSAGDDPRVRRYLALAVGRLRNVPPGAVDELVAGLDDPDAETRISIIWALASIGDASVIGEIEAMYLSDDAGVRKMAVYALGALPLDAEAATLRNALDDTVADVRWNAAVALARHDRRDGMVVLRRMLDRAYVERNVSRAADIDAQLDPVAEVMVSGLQAVGALKAPELRETVAELSRSDSSLRVREVALRTLEFLEPAAVDAGVATSHG
jgi:HEAT repeat protein